MMFEGIAMGLVATIVTRRRVKFAIVFAGVLIVLWLMSAIVVAYRLTRRSHARFDEPVPAVDWGKVEAVRLTSAGGVSLGAWYVPGVPDGPSVVVLHGNGGCRSGTLALMEALSRQGCGVLAVSLRAHGDSDGDFNDFGYGARHDVVAAVAFLEGRRPGKPVVIQGTSLGAAAAIYAASELGGRVRGYVVEAPYRDIYSAVRNRTAAYLPRPLDFVAYAGLVVVSRWVLPDAKEMSPLDHIADIPAATPILLLVGGRDDRARPDEIRELHRRVASHARMVVFDRAGHESIWMTDPERYAAELARFLGEATGRTSDRSSSPHAVGDEKSP